MLKRTKGYFLLTMLVLTGLAGRLHTDTLSGKERRTLINELKTTRSDFLMSIKNITYHQLSYIPSKGFHPIKEYIYALASLEKMYWSSTRFSLKKQPEKSNEEVSISDRRLLMLFENENNILPASGKATGFKNTAQAIAVYKSVNDEELKYVRTATDNLRHHAIQSSLGNIDTYQSILMMCNITRQYTKKIEEIKLTLNFPK